MSYVNFESIVVIAHVLNFKIKNLKKTYIKLNLVHFIFRSFLLIKTLSKTSFMAIPGILQCMFTRKIHGHTQYHIPSKILQVIIVYCYLIITICNSLKQDKSECVNLKHCFNYFSYNRSSCKL